MQTTHHSEYLKLESVYLKSAAAAFVSQSELNRQWESLNYLSQPDYKEALKEYAAFEVLLKKNAAKVHYFKEDSKVLMDSIYCRDASIATDFGMIICNMGKGGRINEPATQAVDFLDKKIPILGRIEAPGTLEGGDVAWLDQGTLAVGHTYRTNQEGINQLRALLEPKGVVVIQVELPHYKGPTDVFHLMSILSPIDIELAVVYSPLMPIVFRNYLLKKGFKLIEVPEEEFESMGCNVLAIAPREVLMVAGNPETQKQLEQAGCIVHTYNGSHISIPGGGGPTCLTRPLLRSY